MATLPLDPEQLSLNLDNLSSLNKDHPSRPKAQLIKKPMSDRLSLIGRWVILLRLVQRHCKSMLLDNHFLVDWRLRCRGCT